MWPGFLESKQSSPLKTFTGSSSNGGSQPQGEPPPEGSIKDKCFLVISRMQGPEEKSKGWGAHGAAGGDWGETRPKRISAGMKPTVTHAVLSTGD